MPLSTPPRRTLAWLGPAQAPLLTHVAELAGLSWTLAGSPQRGFSTEVARVLRCEAADDLRHALASAQVDLVLIADPGDFGSASPDQDLRALAAARARGVTIATLEPIPAAALDLAPGLWNDGADSLHTADLAPLCPLHRTSRPAREAAEPIAALGPPRAMAVEAWANPAEGSLGAQLFSALEAVLALMGEPQQVHAAYTAFGITPRLQVGVGETLRGLRGDIGVSMRYDDGRSAWVVASDQAGRWERRMTLLGEKGRLLIDDEGFEWFAPEGQSLDVMKPRKAPKGEPPRPRAAHAIADSLLRLLPPAPPHDRPIGLASTLAIAQTVLLSARTGQSESPETIHRMLRG